MEITINAIELASELAHQSTVDELVVPLQEDGIYSLYEKEDDLVEEDDNENLVYKEGVQGIFNYWYDHYLTLIEKCKI